MTGAMTGPVVRFLGKSKALLVAVGLTVAVAGTHLWFGESAVLATLEAQTLNWRFLLRGPIEPSGEVVVVLIDDRTIEKLGRWPLSRRAVGAAVRALAHDGARVVAFDLLFTGARQTASSGGLPDAEAGEDRVLADAIADAGGGVVPFAFTFAPGQGNVTDVPETVARSAYRVYRLAEGDGIALSLVPKGLVVPAAEIADAANGAHVTVVLDHDGNLRYDYPVIGYRGSFYPSLPIEVARLALEVAKDDVTVYFGEGIRLGDRWVATDALMRLPVNHYGPRGTFPTYSLVDVIEGGLPPGTFRGRIVLIGGAAVGVGDTFATPYDKALPGVEHYASVVDNIIHDDGLVRGNWTLAADILAILFGGLTTAAITTLFPPLFAGLTTLALLAGWAAVNYAVFVSAGVWLNFTMPVAATVIVFAWLSVGRAMGERRLRRGAERQRRNLARYVPTNLADSLAGRDRPYTEDRAQNAAVMFVDIVGFTTLGERMAPGEQLRLLRDFHRRVERAVRDHRGTIDKFIGDGASVSFGIPEPGPADALEAVLCARRLADDIGGWTADLGTSGRSPITIGIGLHYGPVVVGEIGGENQVQLTITGDTVNVASRLEALTRIHGVTIVASDALVEAARAATDGTALDGFVELPAQTLRGRARPIGIWTWRKPEPATE
jgi:adenylate cyclase